MTPSDEYGHGTHVAGLIGSSGASSNGKFAGVAPGVKLLALRVLDRKGAGRTSDVIAALEFAVANKERFGIRIVNLSLGHPIYESAASDPLVQAVEAAVRAGLVVVTAAGNYGTNPGHRRDRLRRHRLARQRSVGDHRRRVEYRRHRSPRRRPRRQLQLARAVLV